MPSLSLPPASSPCLWQCAALDGGCFPKAESAALSAKGVIILILFYALEIALLWKLLPW